MFCHQQAQALDQLRKAMSKKDRDMSSARVTSGSGQAEEDCDE